MTSPMSNEEKAELVHKNEELEALLSELAMALEHGQRFMSCNCEALNLPCPAKEAITKFNKWKEGK